MAEGEVKKSRQRHCGYRLPTLVEFIQNILQKYPDGGQILKELIQNADDAGATEVNFFFDERNYGVNFLESPTLARFQGPALYCHNNATFKDEDWKGIRNLMNSGKKEDLLKIGRFGIGFNSVYHITDLPSIVSGDTVAFLDPHEEYFKNEKGKGSSVTLYYFDEELLKDSTKDQFMPFHDVFGCDLETPENIYEGTLFRFPLRTTPSELSAKEYTKEMVFNLFHSLQEEASVVLLFLKNICSISLHKRSENGEVERVFKVGIAEDLRDQVIQRRQEFLNKAARNSGISESRYVTNVEVTADSSTHGYRWLIINQIGSNVERISELATQENLPPWVGMALPLDDETNSTFSGRIFCFLPLPPDVDCETGLPVHVHGAFALTDNRRGLVWPGADNQSSTAEWNKLLLLNVVVDVYCKLLDVLLQNSPSIGIDETSRSQLVYSTLPCKTTVKGHWKVILDPLFQKLCQEDWKIFFAQHISGNSWVGLQDVILDRLVDHNMRETVLRALLSCSQTVTTNVPVRVLDIMDEYFPSSCDITPGLLRSVLKTQCDFEALPEDKLQLLEYILEDGPTHDLEGVPLLPLANLEFSTFLSNNNASSSVLVATASCPRSVLPNFDYRILREDIPTLVKDKLQALASVDLQSKNTTQLVLMNKEIVLQNLRPCLPVEWFKKIHEIVQWMPEKASHPSESWLGDIWTWINSQFPESLKSFIGIPLIQLPAQDGVLYTQLGVLSQDSKFIFASDTSGNSLPTVVTNLLKASGCTVIPSQSPYLRHSDINTYVASATATGVITVLSRASLEKAQGHVMLCSSDERHKLREFLSRLPSNVDSTQRDMLLCLPLFNTLDGSSSAVQSGNQTICVAESNFALPADFQFRKCNQIISSADTSSQQLLHLLGVKILNSAEVFLHWLFPDIKARNVYDLHETAQIMLWILARVVDFKLQSETFIEEMKNLPFVATDEGAIVKASELYDPSDSTVFNLFHGEPNKFPSHDYREAHVLLILRAQMGLCTKDKITATDLFQVAASIGTSSQLTSNYKLQALVMILNETPEYLNQNVSTGDTLRSELLSVTWLPRATTPEAVCQRFPQSMAWYACDVQYFKPTQLCDKTYAVVVGSTMPILNIEFNEKVREELGLTADPPVEQIINQLKMAITVWSNENERKDCVLFKEMLVAIYRQLSCFPKEIIIAQLNNVSVDHWIWHGSGFSSPRQIAMEKDYSLDLRPQLFILPEELKDDSKLKQFFLACCVREKFSEEDVVSVLPALKRKHETSGVPAADVEKDLKLCRSILEWLVKNEKKLSESMQDNLLFPVESRENILILQHYTKCAYCDHDWLRRGESELTIPDEYQLIHNSVPTTIAISLCVPTLSSCLLSAETLGFEQTGPHEPITTRINNILKDYKEGIGVFKELIQNADDAGASKVRFLLDWRAGQKDRLLSSGMSECQGPALWAYNDGLFSDKDFENINKLAGATKVDDIASIGRFGLGFNAVYHLTDVPSFVSREYFVMFDPNCHHLQNHIRDASRPGIRINLAQNPRPLKAFENQFQPYHGIFDCNMDHSATRSFHYNGTLFRFPFRTLVQAGQSEICKTVYDEEKVKAIVDPLRESASLLLVYTQHVTEVELFELNNDQKPEQMQQILSVKRTPRHGTPFIETCSEWWNNQVQDKDTSSQCPSKSECITINVVETTSSSSGEIQQSNSQESWLTSSCMGTASSSDLALTTGRAKGVMPFAETAAKLICKETAMQIPQEVPGEAFCFLPLSIATGLPVHINGYFAITSNRREIWKRGTENDQPFEVVWNESLLSDGIACSYIQLLQEIKLKLPEDEINSLQKMLPCYDTLPSATWKPLVKSIYDKIVNESLEMFWCNGGWLDINSGFILDENLRKAPGVISTLNSLERNVFDLTEEICQSFKKSGHEATINSRTLTLERFFQELFFPNISRIAHQLREPLVCFGLDCILKGHEELEMLFKENESILNGDGNLMKPADLFDPNDTELQELFFEESEKFPSEDFANVPLLLTVLKKLGMRSKETIKSEELLKVAKTISLSTEYSALYVKKSQALVNIFQSKKDCLSRDVNGYTTLKKELRSIKWLPRAQSPPESCRYPEKMPWFDFEDAFFAPDELCSTTQALLIGSCMPVVDVIPDDNLLQVLGVVSELPLEKVVQQLSKAVQLWCTDPQMNITSQFQDLILALYYHFANIPQGVFSSAIKEAGFAHWIWHGAGFAFPEQVAIENDFVIDLHPHLFFLQKDLHQNESLKKFFVENGVRTKFSKEDIVSVLSSINEKRRGSSLDTITSEEIEHDIKLCRFIVERLVEGDKELSVDLQEKVLVPIQTSNKSLVLKPCKECTFCDHEWLRQGRSDLDIPKEYFLIDESISAKIAKLLGVKPLSTCLMSGEELRFEQTGPYEPLTTRLNNILKDYKEGVAVFKELVQNADDAGATKVCFLIDWREGPKKSLFSPAMSECQGPALWAYNNGVFTDEDFKNINKLAGATKVENLEKIGRFGLGFNAVYHLTDVPSFVSREYLVMFDPNIHHLMGHIRDKTRPGIRFDLAKNVRPLTAFVDQFQPYHDVFQCNTRLQDEKGFNFNGTLFRFPYRTLLQASRSEISQEVYGPEKVKALVNSLKESVSLLLLYTQRVNEVELYELGKSEDPKAMRLILSTRKNVEPVNLELGQNVDAQGRPENKSEAPMLSFIEECSDWWKANLLRTAVLPSPCRSDFVSIQVTQQETGQTMDIVELHTREEQWLVSSCMGTDSSLQLAMNKGQQHGLLPCAGTATKLSKSLDNATAIPEAIFGEAFCFLPLSIATGLPVHINSSFAVMSNRRHIWERDSSTQEQHLEVRWNESLMSDALCNAYIQLLKTMKSLYENGSLQDYPFHMLWPRYNLLESSTWKIIGKNVYSKLVGNSLLLLRSNGTWLDFNGGYFLADDLYNSPNVTKAMQCLNENVFEMPEDVRTTLIECGQGQALQRRTLTLERFFTEFVFPNISKLSHEIRNPLVSFGLRQILSGRKELEALFTENACIPCSEDSQHLARPCDLVNPEGDASKLFSPEDNRFPVGELFLQEDIVYVLEKLGMRKDLLSCEQIYERARSVESASESCYVKALQRSRNLVEYLNKYITKLPSLQEDARIIQEIRFLSFMEPPKDYRNGLLWKSVQRKKEQFCSPKELFLPRHMDLVGSCCLILSTGENVGCGKLEDNVKDVFGMLHRQASHQQVLEQLDNTIQAWLKFNIDDKEINKSTVLKICKCFYEYLDKYFANVLNKKDAKSDDTEEKLLSELVKRKWLFINDTFVSCDQVARNWHGNGAPYLYGLPNVIFDYKNLLQMTKVKEMFDAKDFLNAINSLQESKGCTPLTDGELEVAVAFLNEFNKADEMFLKENSDQFYLPDNSQVLAKAVELTINSSPWLKDRGDSRDVHKDITPDLAFKLGAKTLLDKRIGKYSKTMGTPFGQHEELTDRLNTIFTSYPCDSGILKELVQNADDSQATEIHFIYDKRTLPCNEVFQNNANEIQGPALCVYNNRPFSKKDFEGIQNLGIGSKSDNSEKTGQFGLGFNAVYHLTDCPSFISNGKTLCVLDPHCRYAPGATYEYPGQRFDPIDKAFQDDFPDVMKGYLGEFGFDLRGSTMFRLPLRTDERSRYSKISNEVGVRKISSLIRDFKGEAKRSMLFLNNIKKISISEIDISGYLIKEYEVTSNVEEKDMEKVRALLLHKQQFKDVATKKIPWQGVTFPLVLYDTNDCVEHWLVHQCYGVKVHDENYEIPDGKPYKLLPHGGLAALVNSNRTPSVEAPCYFAYCFLPLPVFTSLPVHVNGHFAIDSGRRELWKGADSKDPLALWNDMVKRNVLAPGYATLILEARKYMPYCKREGEDKTSWLFPDEASADFSLCWYHKLFPDVSNGSWSVLTLAVYAFLANNKDPVLPVVVADESNKQCKDMPRRVKEWFPVQKVFFVDKYDLKKHTVELIKTLLGIHLPLVNDSLLSIQLGFQMAHFPPRVMTPESVMLALRNYCSADAECKIGILPCYIEAAMIGNKKEVRRLITYCQKGKNFRDCLPGLPLLLTADDVLRVFSQEEKVYCSEYSDLFPKQADQFVNPEIVTCLSHVMRKAVKETTSVPEGRSEEPLSEPTAVPEGAVQKPSTDATNTPPIVMLPLTTDVVATFMSDIFAEQTREAKNHLDYKATGVSEEWLKRLWIYLQTYAKEVDDTEHPLDCLKAWPIVPTKTKKLVTVEMAKTVIDMTLLGNESDAMKRVREGLGKLNCPCLETSITLPEQKPLNFPTKPDSKIQPSEAVTRSYVAHPHNVPDVLNVFDFMLETGTLDAKALLDEDITAILQFIQDGYQHLDEQEKYKTILKRLPFYKAINGKHYKLSEFSEYAVIPAGIPTEEIDTLQENTQCLFLHSDMLPTLENLLTELDAGTKRSTADFYACYILPNFPFSSNEMRFKYLTHIRDHVLPSLYDESARNSFLSHLKRTKCIPDKTGEYVHALEFYDPRHKVFMIMEEESSKKFPPVPFNETEWLNFLVLIGMLNDVDEALFIKYADRVANEGNSSPNETTIKRSKTLLRFFARNHHLHGPRFLRNLSTVKFIASDKVEDVYLSLYKQHCCDKSSDNPPFAQFSNAVPWEYRSLVWTSAYLLPDWREYSHVCDQDSNNQDCNSESLHKHLQVRSPSLEMVISHLQNISDVLAEYSKKEQVLPGNTELTTIMNCIYGFLQRATKCARLQSISACSCSNICKTIGIRLGNTLCILVDGAKVVVKGDQLSFKIQDEKSLEPFIYEVPREYGKFEHLLKRLGATETITPLQLVNVFKKMKDRTKDNVLDPDFEKKARDAMFLLFKSLMVEAKEDKQSSIAGVQELYLPSRNKILVKSIDLLCKIPPKHIETIARLPYQALCFFETCGLQRELENEYLEALPSKLQPKPFHHVAEEKLDKSCLKKPCKDCNNGTDCEFVKKFKVLLQSKEFRNGIIRILKHQKSSSKLSPVEKEVASRLFLNKVEIKCMERVRVHLILTSTGEALEGSSAFRKSYVVKLRQDAWTLYMVHGKTHSNLAKSINKIFDWKIKEKYLLAVSNMLDCTQPFEIPEALNDSDIQVDAARNDDVELGCEVPVVFHQLLQQDPLFVFHVGERVAFCAELPDEDDSSPVIYILAQIVRCVTSNSDEGKYDFEATYLIDIGSEKREVSVLDLYKFYVDYCDENSCKDLVPFTGNAAEKPKSYDEAKREILEALRAAWRLPPEQRRKAIRRLYLRWHPDKNPGNVEFATTMMAFLLEEIKRIKNEEKRLTEKPEHFNFEEMFERCARQAARESATYQNYRSSSSSSFSYTSPNPREAKRWIQQAEGDLSTCRCLLTATKPFHALASFQSQQIVEKSLKAALYAECGLAPDQLHTHDVYSLAMNVGDLPRWKKEKSIDIVALALVVSPHYLPTRYPNQQPFPIVPFDAFDDKSERAVRAAAEVIRHVKEFIGP